MSEKNELRDTIARQLSIFTDRSDGFVNEGVDIILDTVIEALPKISSKSTNHDEGSGYRRYLEGQEDYQESITAILQAAKGNV